jgi:hypothetical protein
MIQWGSGLILTGFLVWGVFVARGTLKAIEKQATIMGEQREVMTMQMRAMHAQLTGMSEQTQHLERAVMIVVSKERARISIKVDKLTLREAGLQWIEFDVIFYGLTAATIIETSALAAITDSLDKPKEPGFRTSLHDFPSQIPPGAVTLRHKAFMFPKLTLDDAQIEDVYAGKKFIHAWGFVKYKDSFFDVFPIVRETAFRLVWRFPDKPDSKSLESPGKRYGFWVPYGEGANRET